ncbi:hypothetical protein N7492_006350 [Penicillium capsulatum]|uniref:Uncharacterized protein n=1 Tax=Penicillium capsulatum TaxID=69766 RepID=A0A9W9I3X1_9EURO|nr:hypothetical protein N7492_006350 [Penicillium capsulatum]KAJ6108999.1 hypothetical protein N7512_008836 [Penicillium capsulatum]
MPRATFNDGNITLCLNRKYPHMLVELLDKDGRGQGYLGTGNKVEHFTGDVEAINVKWDSLEPAKPVQTIEIAENVDFDTGIDVTLHMNNSGFYFAQEKKARFYYEY